MTAFVILLFTGCEMTEICFMWTLLCHSFSFTTWSFTFIVHTCPFLQCCFQMQSMTSKQANQKLDHTLHRSVCSKQQAVLNFCRHHLRCTWDSAHNRQTPCHKACLKSDCTDLCWCDSACPLTACEQLLCALPLKCSSQAAWFPLVPDANYPLLCAMSQPDSAAVSRTVSVYQLQDFLATKAERGMLDSVSAGCVNRMFDDLFGPTLPDKVRWGYSHCCVICMIHWP